MCDSKDGQKKKRQNSLSKCCTEGRNNSCSYFETPVSLFGSFQGKGKGLENDTILTSVNY